MPEKNFPLAKAEILEIILSEASDQIYIYDRNGLCLYANPAGAAALGLKPSDITGKTWQELGLPADFNKYFDNCRETGFQTGLTVEGHIVFPTLAGLRDCQYIVKPVPGHHAAGQAAVCIIKALAARQSLGGQGVQAVAAAAEGSCRLAQEKGEHRPDSSSGRAQNMRVTEGQLQIVADTLPGLIAYIDAEQRYRFNNRAYWEWFGYSTPDMRGRHIKELLGDSAYEMILPYVEAALAGHTVKFEQIIPYKGAGNRHVVVCYIPDCAADGEVKGFFAVTRDITTEKDREQQDRRHLLELAHVGRLATAASMVTEIIHEINQPLAAIANYSSACLRALQAEMNIPKIASWLEKINAQAKRASQIVQRLRRFVGKRQGVPTLTEMNTLARDVIDLMALETRAHHVKVDLEPSKTACRVIVDPLLIEQVIVNLLRNAIEAMIGTASRERRLWIKITRQEDRIAVSVRDNGPGVAPELREQLFQPFITSKTNGLGMGLAISRSIIEAAGGQLWVSSSAGAGTTFSFTLPVAEREGEGENGTGHGLCRR
jgi:PAS domain S-box-containing protein